MTATKSFTKIMLLKEMVFPYSGKAYVTFPRCSSGFLVEDWNDVHWLPQDEIEQVKALCKDGELKAAYVENKLICVSRYDFTEIDHGCIA